MKISFLGSFLLFIFCIIILPSPPPPPSLLFLFISSSPYSLPFTSCFPFSSCPYFFPLLFPASGLFFLPFGIFSLLGLSLPSISFSLFPKLSRSWSLSVFGLEKVFLAFQLVWTIIWFLLIFSESKRTDGSPHPKDQHCFRTNKIHFKVSPNIYNILIPKVEGMVVDQYMTSRVRSGNPWVAFLPLSADGFTISSRD